MNITKRIIALAVGSSIAVLLGGCTASSNELDDGGKLRVVTATTQLTDFASELGQDEIELTGLLAPGASSHQFDPSPADLLALQQADALVINGAGLDEFIDSAIDASGFSGTLIDASTGVDLDLAREITAEAREGADAHAGEAHDDEEHSEHEHAEHDDHDDAEHDDAEHADDAEHDHDDHDHGSSDLNPHLWTSPRFAEGMVAAIASELGALDTAHADLYDERANAYIAKLDALDAWAAAQFERIPAEERVLVTGHDSMRYYLHDYGITYAGSLLPSFDDNAEPSAAEVDALVDAIERSGVRAIFVESSLSPKLAQAVAKQADVNVVDAEFLFIDSLGPEGSGAETYIAATVHNTRLILEAWGESVDALPAELESQ